jgi:hypothetical protein
LKQWNSQEASTYTAFKGIIPSDGRAFFLTLQYQFNKP